MPITSKKRDTKKPFAGAVGSTQAQDTNALPPIFSFENMVDGNGFSVNCCVADDQAALAKRLFKLSKLSWREITQAPRHGMGTEKIAQDAIKVALPACVTADVSLLAMRFNGMKPMIGYRDGRIFYVLLLDHAFTAYNH